MVMSQELNFMANFISSSGELKKWVFAACWEKGGIPYGTTFANDIFSLAIILSDTDFQQPETYLNVTGLDLSVPHAEGYCGEHRNWSWAVYFAHIRGLFFMYTFITAKILYTFLSAASLILVRVTCVNPAPALKRAGGFFQEQKKGMITVITGLVSPWVKEKVFVVSALTFKDVKDLITGTWSLTIKVAVAMQVLYAQPLPLKWSPDDSPPGEHAWHHVKEVSFYGTDTYPFDITN
ncbi:uncharacterized protein LACBIDRAFT_334780 [Laccaria bicolor S238N-H82]|uniref:Predicted protein n=1 Tax=Laccaria bicolor (strain S238N-H82 / ATCC MYA-4686) TaxID=486041 RepID=B0E0A4_LACBS|nr:uncharacterized protein LACBIDRAFT_334780 [Laccaria bicolor S238N-H82]EDQ99750.1 predicted protein [Laccaria bicolor S238N-H82]|eukprot:XP_001889586.1 predicted protein [Laccaria bicolor S238N-H82]